MDNFDWAKKSGVEIGESVEDRFSGKIFEILLKCEMDHRRCYVIQGVEISSIKSTTGVELIFLSNNGI